MSRTTNSQSCGSTRYARPCRRYSMPASDRALHGRTPPARKQRVRIQNKGRRAARECDAFLLCTLINPSDAKNSGVGRSLMIILNLCLPTSKEGATGAEIHTGERVEKMKFQSGTLDSNGPEKISPALMICRLDTTGHSR